MIRLQLNQEEKESLIRVRSQTSNGLSERALIVLMNVEGKSVAEISAQMKRHPHTVRYWLKRFHAHRMKGLNRNYSPGRPSLRKMKLIPLIEKYLEHAPRHYGYANTEWTVHLLAEQYYRESKIKVSEDTVQRALKDAGYSYRRTRKGVPMHAPTREEKQQRIVEMIDEIRRFIGDDQAEIFSLDETYFSTEPYIIRGWLKKKWPPENKHTRKKRKLHRIWCVEYGNTTILLEAITQG